MITFSSAASNQCSQSCPPARATSKQLSTLPHTLLTAGNGDARGALEHTARPTRAPGRPASTNQVFGAVPRLNEWQIDSLFVTKMLLVAMLGRRLRTTGRSQDLGREPRGNAVTSDDEPTSHMQIGRALRRTDGGVARVGMWTTSWTAATCRCFPKTVARTTR